MNPAQVLQYPMVNGCKTSFCSIEFKVGGGINLPGIKSISYSDKLDYPVIYANHHKPVGRTRGQVKPEGSIEVYRDSFDALLEILTIGGKIGYADKAWPLSISYAEMGVIDIKSDLLKDCRIHSPDFSGSEGTDALTVKLTLQPMEILYHGSGAPKVALFGAFSKIA